jgi:hypothetical protein
MRLVASCATGSKATGIALRARRGSGTLGTMAHRQVEDGELAAPVAEVVLKPAAVEGPPRREAVHAIWAGGGDHWPGVAGHGPAMDPLDNAPTTFRPRAASTAVCGGGASARTLTPAFLALSATRVLRPARSAGVTCFWTATAGRWGSQEMAHLAAG